jgi:pantoate--beta-alanine ligase
MVTDLCMPVEIIGVPIQRDANGLALSSRNSYLSEEEKGIATKLSFTLREAGNELSNRDFQDIEEVAIKTLTEVGMRVDYFSICDAHTLEPASKTNKDIVILAAVYLGETRLIDNFKVTHLI